MDAVPRSADESVDTPYRCVVQNNLGTITVNVVTFDELLEVFKALGISADGDSISVRSADKSSVNNFYMTHPVISVPSSPSVSSSDGEKTVIDVERITRRREKNFRKRQKRRLKWSLKQNKSASLGKSGQSPRVNCDTIVLSPSDELDAILGDSGPSLCVDKIETSVQENTADVECVRDVNRSSSGSVCSGTAKIFIDPNIVTGRSRGMLSTRDVLRHGSSSLVRSGTAKTFIDPLGFDSDVKILTGRSRSINQSSILDKNKHQEVKSAKKSFFGKFT